ncbi:MAG: nucleoside 2-deoxyribosyltransferase domain-containing protein [Flavobacteriales bacterium]|nr:nucleoside 2-deoxyribosyltransferase domain-containing protein [Flavobacteriales bacterium]
MKNILYIICISFFLFSCGNRKATAITGDIIEYSPKTEKPNINLKAYTSVFLAGTIDMGQSEDWQKKTIEKFKVKDGNYLFFNPRRSKGLDGTTEDMEYQIRWELEHLVRADYIIMNILPQSKSPISLLEMGLHANDGKMYVACGKEYYRYDNVRITCQYYGIPLYETLDELLEKVFDVK